MKYYKVRECWELVGGELPSIKGTQGTQSIEMAHGDDGPNLLKKLLGMRVKRNDDYVSTTPFK